ncbi:MAG: TIGR02186 family protein [Pseudomonadota bacterium]
MRNAASTALAALPALLWPLLWTAAAQADERVVAALSQNQVSITTTYSGSEIFVFGAVKRDAPAVEARLDVVVAVDGPPEPVIVRRKARRFGIWANADAVEINEAPSFYAVSASGPLDEILSATDDLRHRIGVQRQVRAVDLDDAVDPQERDSFREAVIRLRAADGLYLEMQDEVRITDDTLFAARFALPANLVEGDYRARVFLLHDKAVVDVYETSIAVRKAGLERWLYTLSREAPLIYGLLSIAVALVAGWGASEAFRLLRG